jgi:hypothetical protein
VPPQRHPLHTLLPGSISTLDPLGGLLDQFPTDSCISDVGVCGHSLGAAPQPRNLPFDTSTLEPTHMGTSSEKKGRIKREGWGNRSDLPYSVRWDIQVPVSYRETRRPPSSRTKLRTRILYYPVTKREDIGCILGTTQNIRRFRNARNADTMHLSGAY